ncbi:MAG: hypothetical protein U0871_10685 [Gemmataceae bacterium]
MLRPFFAAAMLAPGRQRAFRRTAVGHVLATAVLGYAASARTLSGEVLGYLLLVLGLIEGAALVGWRLTQLPKSQALEFLLTSPIQPRRLFLAEALVGVCRFGLVQLAGLPVLGGLVLSGAADPLDLLPLAVLPLVWGTAAGLGLTAWVYEPLPVRQLGELVSLGGVLVYLVIGVVAAENLPLWLERLPPTVGRFLYDAVMFLHTMNPFGVVRYWFSPDRVGWVAWERFEWLTGFGAGLAAVAGVRAACRLRGHFHDRHYRPQRSDRASQSELIGDRPLSWWAVRRVMEYSGRVNLWLAGGFALVYAAYLVAGDAWPAWMGRLVFQLFEAWGGAPGIAAGLVVMATVPAAFQFGLWDPTTQARCMRLELLLLSELTAADYRHASVSAAWRRGRGYLFAAGVLWLALGISGRNSWPEVIAAAVGGVVLWGFAFAVGFRAFATGNQTSGLASLMTLGLPMAMAAMLNSGVPALAWVATLLPPGLAYLPLRPDLAPAWVWGLALLLIAGVTWHLLRVGLARCDADLRAWYDRNQGLKSVE